VWIGYIATMVSYISPHKNKFGNIRIISYLWYIIKDKGLGPSLLK
jgi:hypothetical protein